MTGPFHSRTSKWLATRRDFLQGSMAAGIASLVPESAAAFVWNIAEGRPAPADRKFTSPAIEAAITRVGPQIADPTLRAMFARCLPNTLDTTVFAEMRDGEPDTYVITGDIDAMWLRDSSAQVWPYLQFAKEDRKLAALLQGVVRRQTRMILIDPYANAFTHNESDPPLSWAVDDKTEMKPGVAERKWGWIRFAIRFGWRTDIGNRRGTRLRSGPSGKRRRRRYSKHSVNSSGSTVPDLIRFNAAPLCRPTR